MTRFLQDLTTGVLLFLVGAMIGSAQAPGAVGRVTWRKALSRAVTTGGLSLAAGSVLVWLPETSLLALVGLAAALASLGTSGLERLALYVVDRRLSRERGHDDA